MQASADISFPLVAIRTFFDRVSSIPNTIFDNLSKQISILGMFLSLDIDPTELLKDVFSRELNSIPKVVDFQVVKRGRKANFFVFVKEPDWETEEQIYTAYSYLLDLLPDTIDFEVIELFDRKPEDMISTPME